MNFYQDYLISKCNLDRMTIPSKNIHGCCRWKNTKYNPFLLSSDNFEFKIFTMFLLSLAKILESQKNDINILGSFQAGPAEVPILNTYSGWVKPKVTVAGLKPVHLVRSQFTTLLALVSYNLLLLTKEAPSYPKAYNIRRDLQ